MDEMIESSSGAVFFYALLAFSLILAARYGYRYLVFRSRLRAIKKRNLVITEYEAPIDIPPAFFGVIIDNRTSVNDLAATFLSLHQSKHLKITYDTAEKDFRIAPSSASDSSPQLLSHESFVLQKVVAQGQSGLYARTLQSETNMITEFSFLVLQDLQRAGYYQFHKKMDSIDQKQYYWGAIKQAAIGGLIKPWNWPGLLLCFVFPWYGFIWLIISFVFYNRLGLYNYRTPQWEELWPKVAGYYNYLHKVEAPKRQFSLKDPANFVIEQHDPYLTASLLQPEWVARFFKLNEIGAGGTEYDTI